MADKQKYPTGFGQHGVALLTVLFILVLLTVLSVYLIEDEYMAIRRVSNLRDYEQMYHMMTGSEQWAVKVLQRDMQGNTNDHLLEAWHNLLPETQINEGRMQAEVVDLQGRFNLNNLRSREDPWYALFQRLLRVLEIDEALADAAIDWIDADFDVSGPRGAEDPDYLSLTPPYRSANQAFGSTGELIWVAGFDDAVINKLEPFIAALPTVDAKININTAPIALLRALSPTILGEPAAEALAQGRGEEGYQDAGEFLGAAELAGQGDQIGPLIDVSSQFFEVRSRAEFGRLRGRLFSLLQKVGSTQQVRVIHRRRGLP